MADIDVALTALSTRFLQLRRIQALALASAAVALALGLALIAAQIGFTRFGAAVLLVTTAAAFAGMAWFLNRQRLTSTGHGPVLAESLAPELGTAPSSAVDLFARVERGDRSFSRDLAALHVEHTAALLSRIDLRRRLEERERRVARPWGWAVGGALLWGAVLLVLLDTGRTRLGAMILSPGAARLSDVPLTSDIELTYRFPAYTGLPTKVVEGSDGSIAAVVGTEVVVTATTDLPVRSAVLRLTDATSATSQDMPMQVEGDRRIIGTLQVLRDARYRFSLVPKDGDRVEERQGRPVTAMSDASPEISLDQPMTDVEVKDDQGIDILWQARDDFGVAEVFLVLDRAAGVPPERTRLAGSDEPQTSREGRYHWTLSPELLAAGQSARFHLEAFDYDTVSGPKRGVSASRSLTLFSARRLHEDLLARQRAVVDAMVDWLAQDLTSPFPATGSSEALATQQKLLERMAALLTTVDELRSSMRDDQLSKPEIRAALANVADHVRDIRGERLRDVTVAARDGAGRAAFARLASRQTAQIGQLEKDIIYLDDLLALQRIDDLKQTAKDLLTAQRQLQELLDKYRETADPALKAAIEQQIRDLKARMLELLARMAQIKQGLPGEYRNLEAASMLKLDDMLGRLEDTLEKGDLDQAARELEQLANMIENLMNSIDQAEQEYGGERYAELRSQLAEFAQELGELESEQKALAQRATALAKDYRQKAVAQAGKNLDAFVADLRQKAAAALRDLDQTAQAPLISQQSEEEVARARERVLDLDALLEARDFAEAAAVAKEAEASSKNVEAMLENQLAYSPDETDPELTHGLRAASRARQKIEEINRNLDRLFPRPEAVLPAEKLSQMRKMAQKQRSLEDQAQQLGQRMDQLAQEIPLFGGEPRQSLESAAGEMGDAVADMNAGELPGAAQHKRRAVDELGKLRQAMEEASRGNRGGLPLPLGMDGGGQQPGDGFERNRERVEIPQNDKKRADPRFRKELLEAAKQKPPERYEEAVRKYYEELIR